MCVCVPDTKWPSQYGWELPLLGICMRTVGGEPAVLEGAAACPPTDPAGGVSSETPGIGDPSDEARSSRWRALVCEQHSGSHERALQRELRASSKLALETPPAGCCWRAGRGVLQPNWFPAHRADADSHASVSQPENMCRIKQEHARACLQQSQVCLHGALYAHFNVHLPSGRLGANQRARQERPGAP
jgi:hypothetical protein